MMYSFFADYDLQKLDANFAVATFGILRVGTDTSDDEYALLLKRIHKEQNIWERVGLFTTKFTRFQSSEYRDVYQNAFASGQANMEFMLV